MTGFNLPPGCNDRDIPGNRPEDEEYENFIEELSKQKWAQMKEKRFEQMAEYLWKLKGEAYNRGYQEGTQDAAMAQEYLEEKAISFEMN